MNRRTLLSFALAALAVLPMTAQASGPYAMRNRWLPGALSRGPIKVAVVPDSLVNLKDWTGSSIGLKAYGVAVPPGGKIKVTLSQPPNNGYYNVGVWVVDNVGFIPDRCATGQGDPQDCFNNPGKKTVVCYFIVNDQELYGRENQPYTMVFEKSWEPGSVDTSKIKFREQIGKL